MIRPIQSPSSPYVGRVTNARYSPTGMPTNHTARNVHLSIQNNHNI
jgi:hypothetical protein